MYGLVKLAASENNPYKKYEKKRDDRLRAQGEIYNAQQNDGYKNNAQLLGSLGGLAGGAAATPLVLKKMNPNFRDLAAITPIAGFTAGFGAGTLLGKGTFKKRNQELYDNLEQAKRQEYDAGDYIPPLKDFE